MIAAAVEMCIRDRHDSDRAAASGGRGDPRGRANGHACPPIDVYKRQDVIVAREFNVNDDRAQIGKPVDRGRFRSTPPTSDAYYDPLLNEIVFPAGILQPPAFDMQAADAVNYGAIGVVIGHEIKMCIRDSTSGASLCTGSSRESLP